MTPDTGRIATNGECSLVQQTRKDLGDARERVARLRHELQAAETQVDLCEGALRVQLAARPSKGDDDEPL